ncbi:hypothetical protein SAMN03159343_2244 [Klenkia marina]|uniref:Transcription factor WhiB n=1 Tax=Klenkia marina TaxID=1960309 RepID=A0A1G4Y884_9ACTN|nr:hypothetical protein [Klenkia marina]SCX49654.1 hypothetical protein SAMN03159343_2244 [Klenkia marina]
MTRTAVRTSRPELVGDESCACGPRCALTGPCLDAALTDERFGLVARSVRRPVLQLAS